MRNGEEQGRLKLPIWQTIEENNSSRLRRPAMQNTETGATQQASQFQVIALTVSEGEKHQDCSVIPVGAEYAAIYSRVFGPATEDACREWVRENCECPKKGAASETSGDEVNNG